MHDLIQNHEHHFQAALHQASHQYQIRRLCQLNFLYQALQ